MSQTLTHAARLANEWLDGLTERPVQATASLEDLRARFSGPLPEEPSAPEDVISTLDRDMRDGLLGSAGGRFFAWVIGGGLESALAADWLVSTWDQNAALYACGPAVSVVEETAGEWMKVLFIGACDDFETLIPIAKNAGAWVHVDGAFGLFARASAKHRHLVRGLEHADSWATDGHKWLNVPFDCGVAIIRDRAAHQAAMTITAPYIAAGGTARDQIDWNPEWSRRARGVPVYAALRELGRSGRRLKRIDYSHPTLMTKLPLCVGFCRHRRCAERQLRVVCCLTELGQYNAI